MGVETKYTCDRCGHAQATDTQMWSVGFAYAHGLTNLTTYGSSRSAHLPALWCRGCLERLGVLGPHQIEVRKEGETPAPAPPTLEDLVRALAREEAEAVVAERTGAL